MKAALGGLVMAPPTIAPYLEGVATLSDAPRATIDALAADRPAPVGARERVLEAVSAL